MPLKDQIKNYAKKLVEDRPDATALRKMVRGKKPISLRFEDDGIVPNNPKHPVLVYRGAVTLGGAFDPATIIDTLFETNGWGRSWRDGVYDFVHYHSQIHEVMGVARGNATIECGGIKGRMVNVKAGDVVVLPAGTGHRLIEASGNFLVVGAYPEEGIYDECTDMRERPEARKRIAKVRQPKKDPVYGSDGPGAAMAPQTGLETNGQKRAQGPQTSPPPSGRRLWANLPETSHTIGTFCLVQS